MDSAARVLPIEQGVRSARGLGRFVLVGMGAVVGVRLVGFVHDWAVVLEAQTRAYPPPGSIALIGRPPELKPDLVFSLWLSLVLFAAAVLMVVGLAMWTARVRRNAELISPRPHRLARGFAAGCWFIPFANAWLPKVVLDDVWLASDPATRYLPPGHGPRSSHAVTLWWASLVLSAVVWLVMTIMAGSLTAIHDAADYASAATGVAIGNTVLLLIAVVGLGLGAHMVARIGTWQQPRVGAASAPVVGRPGLRPVSGLGTAVLVLVAIWLICALATAFGYASMAYAYIEWFWAGVVMFLVGRIASVLVMIAAGVLLIVWLSRAMHNARLVAPSAPMLPPWTVFAWLIPVVNLVLPPRLLFDVLRAGAPQGSRAVDLTVVASWSLAWTGAWVAAGIPLANLLWLIEVDNQPFFTWTSVAMVCWVVSAALLAAIVTTVGRRQRALARL